MSPSYRATLMDRLGPRAPAFIRSSAWAIPMALLAGAIVAGEVSYLSTALTLLVTLLAMVAMYGFIVGGTLLFTEGAGVAAEKALQHAGSSTPSLADYSYEKALVMRGEVAQAVASYQRHIAEQPERVAPYLLAADLCRDQGDAAQAEALLTRARQSPAASPGDLMHATNRLIDLYLGPLQRPDRARHELRYLMRTFPDTQAALHARAALGRLG